MVGKRIARTSYPFPYHKLPCRVMSYALEARELRIAVSSLPDFRKSVVSCHLTKRHTPVGTALLAEQGGHKKMLVIYAGSKAWQVMLVSSSHEEIVAHVATLSVAEARDFLGPILRLDSGSCNFSTMNPNRASHDVTHCFSPKFCPEWNEEEQNNAIESAQTSLEQMVCLHYKSVFSTSIIEDAQRTAGAFITRCEHGRIRCSMCSGGSICEHGRARSQCKECGGGSICEHGRVRSVCKECGGGSICEHGQRRCKCKKCSGGSFCEHGRRRSRCKECKAKRT